jgi:hypothetical protein
MNKQTLPIRHLTRRKTFGSIVLCDVFAAVASVLQINPVQAVDPQETSPCFMVSSAGANIPLSKICNAPSQPQPGIARPTIPKVSPKSACPKGAKMEPIDNQSHRNGTTTQLKFIPESHTDYIFTPEHQAYTLPDGSVITAKGEIIWPNGVKAVFIPDPSSPGTSQQWQLYRADGSPIKPGEMVVGPGGAVFTQKCL